MKQHIVGIFAAREDAEKAINAIHSQVGVSTDDISYVYRNTDGDVVEEDADDVSGTTVGEGAKKGAVVGGTIGVLAGIATAAGVLPIIGPLFAAGPLASALGLTGALGTAAAGGLTGAAAGGIIGALVNLGIPEEHAKRYEDRVLAGDILVAVHAEDAAEVVRHFEEAGALETEVYGVVV
jgi:hypothetical protein